MNIKKINLESALIEYYGKNTLEYQNIISKINDSNMDVYNSDLNSYIEEIKKCPRITIVEQQKYAYQYLSGDNNAKRVLINSNLLYVILISMKYTNNKVSLEDIIQEGNIGLLIAIDTLNELNINYLRRYINNCIRRNIEKYIKSCNKKINQNYLNHDYFKYYIKNISQKNIGEIFNQLNDNFSQETKINNNQISLNMNIEGMELEEIIPDNTFNPENILLKEWEKEELSDIINRSKLTEKQKKYINIRFGLLDDAPKSINHVAKLLNVTPQAIHNMNRYAIRNLRKNIDLINMYNNKRCFLNSSKKENNEKHKSISSVAKKRVWEYIKNYIYTFFCDYERKKIDNALYTLSQNELNVIENIIKYKDNYNVEEFYKILDKISNILINQKNMEKVKKM